MQRLWNKVAKTSPDECWPWKAYRNGCGYGTIQCDGRSLLAHRVVYELTVGPIPPGMNVLHSCDNPACCNPDHLWTGTQADNIADMYAKGRGNVGRRMTAEAIAKREITFARNNSRGGKPVTEETKAKMRATWARNKSRFGRIVTEETKIKIAAGQRKRWEMRRNHEGD